MGTVFAERVIDMATVFILLLLSAVFVATTRDSAASIYIVIAAFVMAIALLVLMLLMKRYGGALARLLPGRLEIAYHRFHQGTLGSFKQVPAILALGLVSWFLEMCRLYLVVQALDLSIGLALVPVVALGHAILSTVPTPGGVGAVEPGVTGLLLLALERNDAVSVAVVDLSITYVSVIVIGGMVFLLRQILRSRHCRRQVAEGGRVGGPNAAADS